MALGGGHLQLMREVWSGVGGGAARWLFRWMPNINMGSRAYIIEPGGGKV